MIIKSMARKEPTFAQLYDYITRDGDYDAKFAYFHNFLRKERDAILDEFQNNSEILSKRKNGNYLYHEIISITRPEKLSEAEQKERLLDIVTTYVEDRAKDCLVFGGLHDEKDNNLHFHLMISANEYNQSRRLSLKKATFNAITRRTESYVLERYPELDQAKLISKDRSEKVAKSQKEQELKRRTGKPSQKDQFRDRLSEIFERSADKKNFFIQLKAEKIEMYVRGKTIGFLDQETGRKHRLKTLGLVDEFEAIESKVSDSTQAKPSSKKKAKSEAQEKTRADDLGSQRSARPKTKEDSSSDTKHSKTETENEAKKTRKSRPSKSNNDMESEKDKIIEARKSEIKSKRNKQQQNDSGIKKGRRKKWSWSIGETTMPDFLAMFDSIMSAVSLSRSASEASDENSKSAEKKIDDSKEDTKDRAHNILNARRKQMEKRRQTMNQSRSQKHQNTYKRWLGEIIKHTKQQIFRTLKGIGNFLNNKKYNVIQDRV